MNQKISARTLADSLTGDEKIPIGVAGDLATTPNQLKDFIGGGGGVESVTGDGVDNTDPLNPVLSFPTPTDIGAVESVTGDGVDNTDPLNPVLTFPDASEVPFTPYSTIAATDVQGAIEELLDEMPTGGASYWTTLPGTPTRVGNTSFTITDTSNANLYDLKFGRGTVLKWDDTTVHMAMVHSATYSSNTVTITIIGDVLSGTATMNTFKYALEKAEKVTFAIAGTLATGADLARKWKADKPYRVFGADALHGTAGTTNATTYELLKNGSDNSLFTTDISIASGATVGNGYTADDNSSLALNDVVSLSCNTVSTTAPIDVYVDMFIFPTYNQYL